MCGVATIAQVRSVCDALGCASQVTIHSQGAPADFDELRGGDNWRLSLDGNPLAAMTDMLRADILIMGKSSFSYVAGRLNRGIAIYEPFWHQPLPDWICLGPDGSLPRAELHRLKNALVSLRENRQT